jgi:hypothetical protein
MRQPGDIDGDPPGLIFRQHLGLQRFGFGAVIFVRRVL